MPITVRIPYGGGIGAVEHHSESPEAYFAHTPGLRVVTPGGPQDAHTMIRQAVASDDPVVFLEPKRRYWAKAEVDDSMDDVLPLDRARVLLEGSDVTLAAYGPLVVTARDAALAAADDGISVEVVDLRSLAPLDLATLEASVRRTRRLVVTHEAQRSGGLGAEIAAEITERCFDVLRAPVARVTGFDTPYPPAKVEEHFLPDLDRVLDAVDRVVGRPSSLTGWRAS